MDINEIKVEKSKLEFEIRDKCNAFMVKTKTKVDNIDIAYTTYNFATGMTQITNISLSIKL